MLLAQQASLKALLTVRFLYGDAAAAMGDASVGTHPAETDRARSSGGVAMPKRSGSSARGGRAAANVRRTIDFSDIPDTSPEQLAGMRRVGRPPIGKEPRQLIAIRVDPSVLESFGKRRAEDVWATRPSSTKCSQSTPARTSPRTP